MSAFLVPTNTPGYVVARLEDKLGQHSSDTAQINFDNCRIPAENLLGEEGEGYSIALGGPRGRAHRHCRAKRGHGTQRARGGHRLCQGAAEFRQSPSSTTRPVGFRLADCATQLEAARPAHLACRQPCATPACPA
jgi:alkylation response protein AidB-like acyl-CoA dehydrogenase